MKTGKLNAVKHILKRDMGYAICSNCSNLEYPEECEVCNFLESNWEVSEKCIAKVAEQIVRLFEE